MLDGKLLRTTVTVAEAFASLRRRFQARVKFLCHSVVDCFNLFNLDVGVSSLVACSMTFDDI